MPSNCNSYGFSAGFAAVCAAISWFLVQDRSCKINVSNMLSEKFNSEHLQVFHYIAIVVGLIVFALSFFDLAGLLADIKLLLLAAAIAVFSTGVMMLYATYVAFHVSCKSAFDSVFDTANLLGPKNVIEAKDGVGISIMVLDLFCALLLISAAVTFSRANK